MFDVPSLIIPGVGSFNQGVSALRKSKMIESIVGLDEDQEITMLGICLGMYMLAHVSEKAKKAG